MVTGWLDDLDSHPVISLVNSYIMSSSCLQVTAHCTCRGRNTWGTEHHGTAVWRLYLPSIIEQPDPAANSQRSYLIGTHICKPDSPEWCHSFNTGTHTSDLRLHYQTPLSKVTHSSSDIHTLMVAAAMQSADLHIRSSLGFSILPKDIQIRGIKPATFR